ncbi:hypothetical protein [Leptodesmis sp.]|uniref:hypothetical protein n=1 Tax=Leptodesmis sp. TaxID=3100501 RepID=UPI00405350CA
MNRINSPSLALSTAIGLAIASSMFASNPAEAFTLSINPANGSTENTGASALLDFNFVQDGSNVLLNLGIKIQLMEAWVWELPKPLLLVSALIYPR